MFILAFFFFYLPTIVVTIFYIKISRNSELKSNQAIINSNIEVFENIVYENQIKSISVTKYLAYDYNFFKLLQQNNSKEIGLYLEKAKIDYELNAIAIFDKNWNKVFSPKQGNVKFKKFICNTDVESRILFFSNTIYFETIIPIDVNINTRYFLITRSRVISSVIKNSIIDGINISIVKKSIHKRNFTTLSNVRGEPILHSTKNKKFVRGKYGNMKKYYFYYSNFSLVPKMNKYELETIIVSSLFSFRLDKIGFFTIISFGILTISSLLFFIILHFHLIIPIKKLLTGTEQIIQGNYEKIVNINFHNEIGELSKRFNIMATSLQKKDEILKNMNLNLKKKVIQRTKSLKKALEKVRDFDNVKTDLFYSVIHDLKNPLTVITGYATMILEYDNFNEEKKKIFIGKILEESERLREMLDDFLKTLREEHNLGKVEYSETNIENILQYFYNVYEVQAKEMSINFVWDVESPIKSVYGNEEKLEHVVSNLLSNAFKFVNKAGTIRIIARNSDKFVKVGISDTGPGIIDGEEKAIFQKFKKSSGSAEEKTGAGLGLYIAHQIIFNQNGEIWVENNKGGMGCTFYFTVPIYKA